MFRRALALDQDHVRYARRIYRLTTPRTIKAKTINSETKVRIPQMIVTLLLRTAASSLLKTFVTRLATLILPSRTHPGAPLVRPQDARGRNIKNTARSQRAPRVIRGLHSQSFLLSNCSR